MKFKMLPNLLKCVIVKILVILELLQSSNGFETQKAEDYCLGECFQPRCQKSEVVVMKSATYGRMRIGRCIKAEEVDAHRAVVGEDPRYFGCSADVLQILDNKCSGKIKCDICVYDFSNENIQPCFPGLKMYLEVIYNCITILDEERSCAATISKTPVHVLGNPASHRVCGTNSQPWIFEAPAGQKLNISILEFSSANSDPLGQRRPMCYGVIVDKAGDKNISICGGDRTRENSLYLTRGSKVNIFFSSSKPVNAVGNEKQFVVKLQAVGCSDVIPPEDTWLKRKDDTILIGCYSTRQTWQLICQGGKWIGVIGNCSISSAVSDSNIYSELKPLLSNKAQVLAIIAIGGFTVAICLSIICTGAVCLRRYYVHIQKREGFNILSYQVNSAKVQPPSQRTLLGAGVDFSCNDGMHSDTQQSAIHANYWEESQALALNGTLRN